ncbi:MAG: toluene tolerance protein [Pseudomonadales bacterium]
MTVPVPGPAPQLGGARGLDAAQFAALCAAGEVLAWKGGAPAVLAYREVDGNRLIIKLWRRERLSSPLRAYHRRFRRALEQLHARGVPAPRYVGHGRVRGDGARYVAYAYLDGEPLRGRLDAVGPERLAAFVADLHQRGVYFRGLHLANVIELPDGRLGLIDVQDSRFRRRPLPWHLRVRNLGGLCAHPHDLDELGGAVGRALLAAYAAAIGLDPKAAARLQDQVAGQIRRRSARRAARRARRGLEPFSR